LAFYLSIDTAEANSFRLTWSAAIDHRRFTTIHGNFCSDNASDVKKKQSSYSGKQAFQHHKHTRSLCQNFLLQVQRVAPMAE
jgi:hypothetical protein